MAAVSSSSTGSILLSPRIPADGPSSSSSYPAATLHPSSAATMSMSNAHSPRRRIRFAPLPDPRRAVLITDDGDEVPLPLPEEELNHFPASLVLGPPILNKSNLTNNSTTANGNTDDERDNKEMMSSTLSMSTASSSSASSSSSSTSTPRSDSSPISSVGSSPVTPNAALPAVSSSSSTSKSCVPPLLASHSISNNTAPRPPPSKPRTGLSLLRPFKRSSTSSSSSSSHSLTPTPSIDTPQPSASTPQLPSTTSSGSGSGHAHRARKALSLVSPEEILTLGTINLFRASSRESTDSSSTFTTNVNNASGSGSGWGLSRWTSATSATDNGKERRAQAMIGGSPLARTQSTQSYENKKKKKKSRSLSLFSSSSNNNDSDDGGGRSMGKSLSVPTNGTTPVSPNFPPPASPHTPVSPLPQSRHKGTRMLNGRVYGQKRPHTSPAANNPFASARDDEDEFVEWGYGGMGSVKGAKSAGVGVGRAGGGVVNWERLHGGVGVGGAGRGANAEAARKAREVQEEEDDGSGMGWVRKRREERERKKRELEEEEERRKKEEREKEKEVVVESTSAMSTPTPTRTSSSVVDASIPEAAPEIDTGDDKILSEEPESMTEAKQVGKDNLGSFVFGSSASPSPSTLTPTLEKEISAPTSASSGVYEHTPEVVPVPPSRPRHHHHHSSHSHHHHHHKRSTSGLKSPLVQSPVITPTASYVGSTATSPAPLSAGGEEQQQTQVKKEDAVVLDGVTASTGDVPMEDASAKKRRGSLSSVSSSSSTTSNSNSDSEDDDEEGSEEGAQRREVEDIEEEDEEEEEGEEEREKRRKTALGAGVEKVSRHKE
ncbi:hypothetical protein D9613_003284 [Agrocybe pediades]|uniref:Uncharacterized protein n=1 Tax=Agrocybe pediades TaxID=84607 RepID=A0A8H4QQ47_9AGAR|nr:hypothetical protein D9613_003284 [Agrocybe pediades]